MIAETTRQPDDHSDIASPSLVQRIANLFRLFAGVIFRNAVPASAGWTETCTGVDIQGDRLVAVRAARIRGQVVCESVPAAAVTGQAAVACAMPVRSSFTRWLTTPFPNFRKSLKVLPTLLDIELPFALEDCVYEVLPEPPRSAGGGAAALAAVARISAVQERLDDLRLRGLDPAVLDHEGLALWSESLCNVPAGADDQARAVIYLGPDRTVLVTGRGARYQASHAVGDDISQVQRFLSVDLGPNTRPADVNWFWAGPGAEDAGAVGRILDPLGAGVTDASCTHSEPATFLARALARRGLDGDSLQCNLRKGALAHEALVHHAAQRSLAIASACILAGLVLCLANLGWSLAVARRETRLETAFDTAAVELAGQPVTGTGEHAVQQVRSLLDKRLARLRPFHDAVGPSLLVALTGMIDVGARNGLEYETLTVKRDSVSVTGTTADWDSCDVLVAHLRRQGYRVRLTRETELAQERVAFSIVTEATGE